MTIQKFQLYEKDGNCWKRVGYASIDLEQIAAVDSRGGDGSTFAHVILKSGVTLTVSAFRGQTVESVWRAAMGVADGA